VTIDHVQGVYDANERHTREYADRKIERREMAERESSGAVQVAPRNASSVTDMVRKEAHSWYV
jgi:hypothetical protein